MRIIHKAKLKDEIWLEVKYDETDEETERRCEIEGLYKAFIHEDLKRAYARLTIHLALMTECIKDEVYTNEDFDTGRIYTDEAFKKFLATGFTISGSDESYGVTISGRKILRGKRVLNLNTPFTKFDKQQGQDNYKFLDYLFLDVQHCVDEVNAYLEGKFAPNPQSSLLDQIAD